MIPIARDTGGVSLAAHAAAATAAVVELAKQAATEAGAHAAGAAQSGHGGGGAMDAKDKWDGYPDKKSYKAAKKKVTSDAIYATYYVIAGVAGACAIVYAYDVARAWVYRRRARSRGAVEKPSANGAAQPRGALSRALSAMHAAASNAAYVRVIPLWFFKDVSTAEWFWNIAYFGISLGLGFWGCMWQGKLDYANPMGYVAFGQIPILIALAGRNNAVSWLTGVSYEKLNYLHRSAGRVAILTTWLHTLGWFHKGLGRHGPGSQIFLSGMLGSVAALIMWLTSFALVRRVAYEFFLAAHIAMCFIFVIASWYHWPRLGWWCWAGLIVWGFDRGLSFARLILVNRLWLWPLGRRGDAAKCTLEVVDPAVLRITAHGRTLMRWSTGQHAFLTFPQVATLRYEQHPFTICNLPNAAGDVMFLVRAQKGFTRRLLHRAESGGAPLRCYIDGPYGIGHSSQLLAADTLLVVVGGTGVAFGIAHVLSAIRAAREGSTALSAVRMVWNVRDAAHISWIAPMLNDALEGAQGLDNIALAIDVYVTRTAAAADPAAPTGLAPLDAEAAGSGASTPRTLDAAEAEKSMPSTPSISDGSSDHHAAKLPTQYGLGPAAAAVTSVHYGRSPLETILRNDVCRSRHDAGGVAVAVCGPSPLALDARRAVCRVNAASAVWRGQVPVSFHHEVFGW